MNRVDFIKYLQERGCMILREDNQGYAVIRNVINGNMSGVPKNDPLRIVTVCRICKTLDIKDVPIEAQSGEIVEIAHNHHAK